MRNLLIQDDQFVHFGVLEPVIEETGLSLSSFAISRSTVYTRM